MGTSQRPGNYDYSNLHKYLDKQHYVTASEAIQAAIDVARSDGILPGGSGGAVVHVMKHVMRRVYHSGQTIVGVLADHGSRYTDDLFNPEWLALRELPVALGNSDVECD
jgi:cysteine synthase